MFDPDSKQDIQRLIDAMDTARRKLEPYRTNRLELIRQFVGKHYSDNAARDRVPVNLIELAVNIYLQHLVAQSPQVLIDTFYEELKPQAMMFQVALNHLSNEIEMRNTLRDWVTDALFSVGILKVGICGGYSEVEIDGFTHDIGQPYADVISLDDWVHDMSAKRWDQIGFAGNRFRVPLAEAMGNESYDSKVRGQLQATHKNETDDYGSERVEEISRGGDSEFEEFEDMVELWEVWLPRENLVITLPHGTNTQAPLKVSEWNGPEKGPYHILGFERVPDQIMPLPPVSLWEDLHDLANRLWRKLGRQAERQKTILGVQGGADTDGQRIVNANDGDAIRIDSPDKAREYRFGGIDQHNLAFLVHAKDMMSYLAGNLDAIGGLGSQADTLGQEELLTSSASKRMESMQADVIYSTKRVYEDLALYLYTDPLIEMPLVKRIPGVPVDIPFVWRPEDREGDYLDYNFTIEPHSMAPQTPAKRLNTLTQIFSQYIAPFAPLMMEQGIQINFTGLLRHLAKLAHMPELDDILQFSTPSPLERPGPIGEGREASPMPTQTTRRYERVNRPGSTRQGKDEVLMQTLLGGNPQQSQQAAFTRPTG